MSLKSAWYRGKAPRRSYNAGQADARYKFTGKEKDTETGLDYFGARYYDSRIGRWGSVDPLAEKFPGVSPYNYCLNDPVKLFDPTGKSGEAVIKGKTITVTSRMIFYGPKASSSLASSVTNEIRSLWNNAAGKVTIGGREYSVKFNITSEIVSDKKAASMAASNTDIKDNFIKLGETNSVGRSYMDLGGNSGNFVTTDALGTSTTAAHEYGHGVGLGHSSPDQLGNGQPDIMSARGTLVDPQFQYDPSARPGGPGGTINPALRVVTPTNVQSVFHRITFDKNGKANIGTITNRIYQP